MRTPHTNARKYEIILADAQRRLLMAALATLSHADLRALGAATPDITEERDLLAAMLYAAEPWTEDAPIVNDFTA